MNDKPMEVASIARKAKRDKIALKNYEELKNQLKEVFKQVFSVYKKSVRDP